MPDIVQFAYFSAMELRINAEGAGNEKGKRRDSPDPYAPSNFSGSVDSEEHVLVLDFVETGRWQKPQA